MNILVSLLFLTVVFAENCSRMKNANTKLFCYYGELKDVDSCKCTHVILPANSDVKSIERLRNALNGVKILVTVHEFNEGLVDLLKKTKIDGLDVDLKKLDSKNDIVDFITTARSKLGSELYTTVSIPPRADLLAKYYDFKRLTKHVDSFMLQTAFLGASTNVTFHPSRLSGLWDMQNADSVVDLVTGLGAPLSKLVIVAPVQAFQFKLQDEKHTAPGSPALEIRSITREDLCKKMTSSNWTLERDQDQAGPYIFRNKEWIAFDDPTSIDIKAKYARIRGLAGLALKDLSQDGGSECGGLLLEAAYNGLSKQSRAPRGAVLQSLEREILTPSRPLHNIQVSPYRITRIIDTEGKIHAVRQDTRTEFECSRQGYFVHPRSCNRFYRCVKFDQLTDEFNVFEFDCPAGLAFDSRVEVCVWPGSLSDGSACSGSSEIAPVPKERFVCPHEAGYYADPENCRWFFACLDHGQTTMTAYEFRCPFGLVFDQDRLVCEWPWLVPKCASGYGSGVLVEFHGGAYGTHGPLLGVNAVVDAYGTLGAGGLSGGHGSPQGVILENYHGLGVLQPVTLGGLHGPIQEPISKVYSSFGGRGGGDGHGAVLVGVDGGAGDGHGAILGGVHGATGDGRGAVLVGIDGGAGHGHGLVGVGGHAGQGVLLGGGHGLVGANIQDGGHGGVLLSQHGAGGNLGEGAVLVGVDGGGADLPHRTVLVGADGHGALGQAGQGSIVGVDGTGADLAHKTVLVGADDHGGVGHGSQGVIVGVDGAGADLSHRTVLVGADGYGGVGHAGQGVIVGVDGVGQSLYADGGASLGHGLQGGVAVSQNLGGLDQYGHRGSTRFQSGLSDAGLSGKSTTTYHGNLAVSGGLGGVTEGVRLLSTGQVAHAGETDGALLTQNIGLGGSRLGHRGSVRYQGGSSGLDGQFGGKSTVSYHGNFGAGGQVLVDGVAGKTGVIDAGVGQYGAGHDGVVLLQGEGVGVTDDGHYISDQKFGQRGSSRFQSPTSTVTYHGNLGQSDRGDYTVNSPINRASLVFGTKLRGSKVADNVITGEKFSSNYIQPSLQDDGLKYTNQVLVEQGVTNLDGIGGVGKIGQSTVTYHGNSGLGHGSLGIYAGGRDSTLHGNQEGVGIAHGPTQQTTYQSLDGGFTGDSLNLDRGAVQYHEGETHTLSPVTLGQGGSTSYQNYNREKTGRVNIIGGGFSAVGVYPNTYKETTADVRTVTASPLPEQVTPVSVTASRIPVVTSVPIPTTYTSDKLDVYNGNGVVANVPELQVKVESHGAAIIPDIQRTHTASTGAALEVVNGGYVYDKPALTFVEGGSKLVEDSGAKSYVQQIIDHKQPVLTAETPAVTFNLPEQYPGPSFGIAEQKLSYPSPGGHSSTSYSFQNLGKSTVVESSTPSILLQQEISKPAPTISSVHFGTGLVREHAPSVVQGIEVSTATPVSYGDLDHGTIFENVASSVPVQPVQHIDTYQINKVRPVLVENVTPTIPIRSTLRHRIRPVPTVSSVHFGTSFVDNVTPSVLVKSHGEPVVGVEVSTVRPVSYSTLGQVEHVTPSIAVQSVKPAVSYSALQFGTGTTAEHVTPAIRVQPAQPVVQQRLVPQGGSSYFYQRNDLANSGGVETVTPSSGGGHLGIVQSVTPSVLTQPIQPVVEQKLVPQGGSSYFYQRNDFGKSGGFETVTPSSGGGHLGIVQSVTPSVLTQPIQPVVEQKLVPQGGSSYFYQRNDFAKSGGFETVTPSSGGHQSVTPSVSIQSVQPVVEQKLIPHGGSSYFYQNNDFSKSGGIQTVTPSSGGHLGIVESVTPSVLVQPVQPVVEQKLIPQGGSSYFYQNNDFSKSGGFETVTPSSGGHLGIVESVTPSVLVQPVQPVVEQKLIPHGGSSYFYQNNDFSKSGGFETVTPSSGGHLGIVQSVTPSVLVQPVQPVVEQKLIPQGGSSHFYQNNDFSKSGGFETVTPSSGGHLDIVQSVTPSVLVQPVQPVVDQKLIPQDGSSYFYQNNHFSKSGGIQTVTPSVPTASFSFQSLNPRGFEKQANLDLINVGHVTPSPVAIQHEITRPLSIIPSGHDAGTPFLSTVSKSRGFSKLGQIETVTPASIPVSIVTDTKATSGGFFDYQSTNGREFTKYGQSVSLGAVIPVQKVAQPSILPEGDIGAYPYDTTRGRGFVKYTDTQVSVTPQSVFVPGVQNVVGVENHLGTFTYEDFGLKTQTPGVVVDNRESPGYYYAKPSVQFTEEPAVVDYGNLEPVKEVPFVAKKAYVTGNKYDTFKVNGFSSTPLYEENYPVTASPAISSTPIFITSTVRPTYQSTINSVYNTVPSSTVRPASFYYHDSRLSSTPRPFDGGPKIISSTPPPFVSDVHYDAGIKSTIAPIFAQVPVTQSKPIFKYEFSSFDSQYSPTPSPVDIHVTKRPAYNRVISTFEPAFIKSTTVQPLIDVGIPTKTYLPATNIVENYEAPILKTKKILNVVQPSSQAIVKVNDFHPLLSAKLGAQCTCIVDSVRSRNKPVRVQIDDGEHVEEFVVKPDDSPYVSGDSFKDAYIQDAGLIGGENLNVVPDYQPQKVVAITPLPEVTIGSTTPIFIPKAPSLVVRKRVRVRPVQPVSKISDVFLQTTANPNYDLSNDDNNLDGAIALDAPQSFKAQNFDRYGPGGLRSRTETLQGTVDCQRAGLFRHPTQCNKFYSCRWDCTKNKFTLHVFNCPVHLTFDDSLGACNWPSQGPACLGNTLLPSD